MLGLDQLPQDRYGSDCFLLSPGVLVDQASRTKEKDSNYPETTGEDASNQQFENLINASKPITRLVP